MEREKKGKTDYYSSLQKMLDEAENSWLGQTGEKWGSYNGFPHIKNVERNVDKLVPDELKSRFSNTEIFILLSAILLHDIGKLDSDTNHAKYSCLKILKDWAFFKDS